MKLNSFVNYVERTVCTHQICDAKLCLFAEYAIKYLSEFETKIGNIFLVEGGWYGFQMVLFGKTSLEKSTHAKVPTIFFIYIQRRWSDIRRTMPNCFAGCSNLWSEPFLHVLEGSGKIRFFWGDSRNNTQNIHSTNKTSTINNLNVRDLLYTSTKIGRIHWHFKGTVSWDLGIF